MQPSIEPFMHKVTIVVSEDAVFLKRDLQKMKHFLVFSACEELDANKNA